MQIICIVVKVKIHLLIAFYRNFIKELVHYIVQLTVLSSFYNSLRQDFFGDFFGSMLNRRKIKPFHYISYLRFFKIILSFCTFMQSENSEDQALSGRHRVI